ncbi:hypothetical protein D9M69_671770 [compost metagenome]
MPTDHAHPEAGGDLLQAMLVGRMPGMHQGRQQQGVEHRLDEADTGLRLLELEEAHVEGGVVRDQHRVLGEALEQWQHPFDSRLPGEHLRR